MRFGRQAEDFTLFVLNPAGASTAGFPSHATIIPLDLQAPNATSEQAVQAIAGRVLAAHNALVQPGSPYAGLVQPLNGNSNDDIDLQATVIEEVPDPSAAEALVLRHERDEKLASSLQQAVAAALLAQQAVAENLASGSKQAVAIAQELEAAAIAAQKEAQNDVDANRIANYMADQAARATTTPVTGRMSFKCGKQVQLLLM